MKPRRYAALIGVSLVMVTLVGCANTTQPGEAQVQPSTQPKDRDAETKQVLRTVVAAARTAYVDGGSSFNDLTPASLAAVFEGVATRGYDQAGTCTEGSVIVHVAATKKFFGAAAMSPSDVCLWVRDDGISCDGVRTRAGSPCSGEAALGASLADLPGRSASFSRTEGALLRAGVVRVALTRALSSRCSFTLASAATRLVVRFPQKAVWSVPTIGEAGKRRSVVIATAFVILVMGAIPARADIGVYCSALKNGSVGVSGVHQSACYDRTDSYTIRARGKAYYTGGSSLTQLSISVQLQRSLNGVTGWANVNSNVCGWTGGGIANGTPGNICNTPYVSVVAGYIYRGRASVTVFYTAGGSATTSFSYSGLTT